MYDEPTDAALEAMTLDAAELAISLTTRGMPMFHNSRSINRIDAQIAALEEQRLRLLNQPEDIYEEGDVVWFRKRFSSSPTEYTFAAVKVGQRWILTGRANANNPMPWDALLTYVGDNELWVATEWQCIQ